MLPSSLLTRKFHFHLFRVINVFHPLKGKLLTVKKNFSPWIFEERQKLKIGSTKICVKSIIQNYINIWKLHIKEISASRIRDFHKYLKNISALFKNFLGTIFSLFVNSNALANYNEQEITTRLAESQQKALNFLCAKQHTPRSLITPPPLSPSPCFARVENCLTRRRHRDKSVATIRRLQSGSNGIDAGARWRLRSEWNSQDQRRFSRPWGRARFARNVICQTIGPPTSDTAPFRRGFAAKRALSEAPRGLVRTAVG